MTTDDKMLPDDGAELSAATVEFATSFFDSPLPTQRFGVEQLVRSLSGLLPEAELTAVFQSANRSASQRQALVQIRRNLDILESLPWAKVAALRESEDELMALTAVAWLKVINEQLSAKSTARQRWESGWKAIQSSLKQGVAEAQAAHTEFSAFAEQWRKALLQPNIALVRGGEDTPLTINAGLDTFEIVIDEAAIDTSGTFRARAQVRDSSGNASHELDGVPVYLGLSLDKEVFPISSAMPTGDTIEWVEYGIGRIANLPTMLIPSSYLWLGLENLSPSHSERTIVLAEVADQEDDTAPVILDGEPHWEVGELHLAVELPRYTREFYANALLEISLFVSPGSRQLLGTWPVSDWPNPNAEQQLNHLTVACPDSANVERISMFSFHMRILVS